jgi:hypothetical protein
VAPPSRIAAQRTKVTQTTTWSATSEGILDRVCDVERAVAVQGRPSWRLRRPGGRRCRRPARKRIVAQTSSGSGANSQASDGCVS